MISLEELQIKEENGETFLGPISFTLILLYGSYHQVEHDELLSGHSLDGLCSNESLFQLWRQNYMFLILDMS